MSRRFGMDRRTLRSLGGGVGGNVNPFATLIGVANISSANYFESAAGTGPSFAATTGAVGLVWRKIVAGNLTREYRHQRFTNATRGWQARIYDGVTTRASVTFVNATPANTAEVNTIAPTQNLICRTVHVNRGGTLEVYFNGSLTSAGTALASYTAPTTEPFQIIGSAGAVDEWELVSVTWRNAALDATAIAAWDAQVVALGSRAFDSADGLLDQWPGGATWVDSIGGLSFTTNGTPTRRDITGATFQ